MRKLPLSEQIHVAWFCVRGMDRRFEDAEAEFIRRLDEMGLPVILVLTQVPRRSAIAQSSDGGYHPDAVMLAEQIMARRLPIAGGRPFMTYAKADEFTGQRRTVCERSSMPPFALRPKASTEPSSRRRRSIRIARRRRRKKYIAAAATSAAAAAATPDPVLRRRSAGADPAGHDGQDRPAVQDQVRAGRADGRRLDHGGHPGRASRVHRSDQDGAGSRHGRRRRDRRRRRDQLHLRDGPGLADGVPAGGQEQARGGGRGDRQRSTAGHVPRGVPQETEVRPQGTAGGLRRYRPGRRQGGPGSSSRSHCLDLDTVC